VTVNETDLVDAETYAGRASPICGIAMLKATLTSLADAEFVDGSGPDPDPPHAASAATDASARTIENALITFCPSPRPRIPIRIDLKDESDDPSALPFSGY
jgi:hypothetical protein